MRATLFLLAKSLRPLPVAKEKEGEGGDRTVFDPFSDKELRYRQRYVDLVVNPDVRDVFIKRAKIIAPSGGFSTQRGIWRSKRRLSSRSTAARSRVRS